MPHQTLASVRQLQGTHAGEISLSLDLDGLREQLARTDAQDLGQGIVDRIGLTQADNVDRFVHGVSLSRRGSGRLDTRLDTPPFSNQHHPLSAIAQRRGK